MSRGIGQALRRLNGYIILASVLLFFLQSYFLWQSIVNEAKTELTYTNKLVSGSMHSLLSKNEALFKVASERLLELGINENNQKAINLIDDILQNNPELIGIGIADPQGKILFSTSNLNVENLPNLLEKEETSESFKQALNNDSMVMGRTYYLQELHDWVVPLRYRIVNKDNQVVAVFTTGLKINGKNGLWKNEKSFDELRISIINSKYYFLFGSFLNNKMSRQKLYEQPISQSYLKYFSETLEKQTGYNLKSYIQGHNDVVNIIYQGPTKVRLIAAFSYDPQYYYYTFTTKKISGLYQRLVTPLIWVLITIVGFNLLLYFLFRHVSQLEQTSKQELQYQAQHDQLTGLPNLRYIEQYFQQWKSQNGNAYSVVFLDLDNFKNSNDLHGHAVGDRLLQKVAKRIQLFFNECLCLRQGGDEFIVIVPRNYCSDIERKVEEFLLDLKKTIFINKLEFSIRASIGISSSPKDGLEIDSLLRKADIAMYEAKRHKTGWHVFSRKLDVDNSRKSMIEKELNSALERKEMSVVYQPQVDNHDKLIGVEALLRWNNKLLGQVPPDEFIAIAESTGMILDIGNFVFETSLKEFHHVCKRLFSDSWVDEESKLRLSINLSVRQLIEEGFTDRLFSLINQYDCKNTRLMLEITETMTIDRVQEVRFLLEKIQRAGIEISLDDFGTGYSSLSHLSQLPINEIKIDKSFIHSSLQNIQDVTFIKSIIYLGNKLDVKVLAEGVETSEQVVALKQYGCKYFQGFYFSHPLNIQQLQDYIGKTECQTS